MASVGDFVKATMVKAVHPSMWPISGISPQRNTSMLIADAYGSRSTRERRSANTPAITATEAWPLTKAPTRLIIASLILLTRSRRERGTNR